MSEPTEAAPFIVSNGIPITIAPYTDMSPGDQIEVTWGGSSDGSTTMLPEEQIPKTQSNFAEKEGSTLEGVKMRASTVEFTVKGLITPNSV
ncbi:hypothetical protein BGZ83_009419 [Gryganskiella cystojenkinii]|nr:hypothetical protein BGZ83_009419 [Gryganskiella cystojenkinii]